MKLVWLDIETTGLNPNSDLILEIAVATADLFDPFNVTHVYNQVCWFYPHPDKARELEWTAAGVVSAERAWCDLDPFIVELHTKNGLLAECWQGKQIYDVERDLLDIVPDIADKAEKPVLAGSTIHFDHSFLATRMPTLSKRLSHRHYDVSALKLYAQSMGMPKFKKAEAHRAKADIVESVDHAAEVSKWLKHNL